MKRILAACLCLATGVAGADSEDDALLLADSAPRQTATARDWQLFAESAFGGTRQRHGAPPLSQQRLSLDFALDKTLAPGWRAVLADRLDIRWQNRQSGESAINTLKEAYLGWQAQPEILLDFGRINVRNGVATGYNPTDFFRSGAVRSVVSVDPASLKSNRLGSVMLRGQTLWVGGSFTALYSPRLQTTRHNDAFAPDFGATNNTNRWLLAASQQISDGFSPQALLYGEAGQSPQLGLNLTALLNQATVAHFEWSGGRSRSQYAQALNGADDSAFRQRLASGLSYTTPNKLTLTLEYEYNGSALDQTAWSALARSAPQAYWQYRQWLQNVQDLPTRRAAFAYLSWQDALLNRLDLNAMRRTNLADRSHLSWLEARYRFDGADAALRWQRNSGGMGSEFGALPQQRVWQVLLRYFW